MKSCNNGKITHTMHTDHLGGINVLTDQGGEVTEFTDYYPYGSLRIDDQAGSFTEQRKYIGEEYDAEVGLSYLNARQYEGARGQFLSQDPTHLVVGDVARLKAVTGYTQEQILSDPQLLNSAWTMHSEGIERSGLLRGVFDAEIVEPFCLVFQQEPPPLSGITML